MILVFIVPIAFRMNSSDALTETQVFRFHSTGKEITVTLKPGEDILLCESDEEKEKKSLTSYEMCFNEAEIAIKDNYLVLDNACYSKDGECYSEPLPIPALFNQLLQEQYCGEVYFSYEFEVKSLPEKIYLRVEKSNDIATWLNDNPLTEVSVGEEDYVLYYDITKYVKLGMNRYIVKVNWYQNDNVFYALFGENVTESLKNCIVYDTELQPVELVGKFGVYSKEGYIDDVEPQIVTGNHFYIGELPIRMEREPVTEGFPFLADEMTLRQSVDFDTTDILLQVPGDYHIAYVKVNGRNAGRLFFESELDISQVANIGKNDIEVRFILSNRNRMGPHHVIAGRRDIISPWSFEFGGEWKDGLCESYHESYDFKKFYKNK